MTLYLARHGRSLGQGLFLGQSDPELSDEGRQQSAALAETLVDARIDRIVCSTLARSVQTAAIIGKRLRLRPEPDVRLSELAYGQWDGLPWDEIEQRWPEEARRKLDNWWAVTPPGGEPREDFHDRVLSSWNDIRGRPETTLLVGHAGVNGLLAELARSGGRPDWERVTRFEQGYGQAMRIEVA